MKKDLDETLQKQLREFYAHYYKLSRGIDGIYDLIKDKPEIIKILSETFPWSTFYELPYRTFLAICTLEFGATQEVKEIAASDNQLKTALEHMKKLDETDDEDEELTDEEKAFRFSLVIASFKQLSSMAIHSQPLSSLIVKVREGDDEALFDAVLVDQSIVAAPTVARRIQAAQLEKDGHFMDLLSRAIKGSRPKRENRDKSLDDLRYMMEVANEEAELSKLTHSELYDILAEDLELYDKSLDGFIKVIQRRNKRHRT